MPPVVNVKADIACCHQGKVTLVPKQTKVSVGGAPALRAGDVAGNVCACPVAPSPATKPCTTATVTPTPGVSVSRKVFAAGKPVMLGNPTVPGVTDSAPVPCPTLMVRSPGQIKVVVGG